MPVEIRFAAMVGSTPVRCGMTLPGLGTTNAPSRLEDLRFYVSNPVLVRTDGRRVPVKLAGSARYNLTKGGQRLTLIDLENGTAGCATRGDRGMNAVIRGTVPRGAYRGLRYYVGVPFKDMNHTDVVGAPLPLASTEMAWSWQSGRKFTKIELGDPEGPGGSRIAPSFMVHMGSTGCVGNPASGQTVGCTASNRIGVNLRAFNPQRHRVKVDLKALFAKVDITTNTPRTAAGCMGGVTDPECGPIFEAFGVDWKADGSGNGRTLDGGLRQTVFRAIAR